MACRRADVVAWREGWVSEWRRVSSAVVWVGSVRRGGEMDEGDGGVEGRGGRWSALGVGGRRRDSQVCRSLCRLDVSGTVSVRSSFLLRKGLGGAKGYVRTGLFVALGLVSWRDWRRSWDSVLAMRVLVLNRSAMAFSWYTVAAHFMPRNLLQHTLLNQSDISDFVEKSFSSCD